MTNAKKIIIGSGIVLVLVIAVIIAISIKHKSKEVKTAEDYRTIEDVPGCTFAVDKVNSDMATAVTEISKSINFIDYETYSYKNGQDLYILFCMRRYIVIAKKGTDFFFSRNPVEQTLQMNSLQGIWFTPKENAKLKKEDGKYYLDVTAEVTITNTLYNDFEGTLTTFERNNEEWSLFVGYVENEDEESVKMTKYVRQTLAPVMDYQPATAFKVDIETAEVTEEDVNTEGTSEEDGEDTFKAATTQREVETEEEGTAYSSNKYSMLPVGAIGYMDITNEDTGNIEPAYIRITKVLDEEQTRKTIDEIVTKNQTGLYAREIEVPENCHLEMAFYDVRYTSETKSLVKTELCSVDGSEFRYRGVKYSPKTYQIKDENDWVSGYAVYYIIPNGCTKYGFSCSGIMESPDIEKAWFNVVEK